MPPAGNRDFPAVHIRKRARWRTSLRSAIALFAFTAPVLASTTVTRNQAQAATLWLQTVNDYRANAGLPPLREDETLAPGSDLAARYVLGTGHLSHTLDPASPYFTTEGQRAARFGLLAGWRGLHRTDRGLVEDWMVAPFHAVHLLDPSAERVSFAARRTPEVGNTNFDTAAVLQLVKGSRRVPTAPITFPGRDTSIALTSFSFETPDPLSHCDGYGAPSGLPLLVLFPTLPSKVSSTLTSDGQPVEHCAIDRSYRNPDAQAQASTRRLIELTRLVVIVPRQPLRPGASYDVHVDGGTAGVVAWRFRVDANDQGRPSVAQTITLGQPTNPKSRKLAQTTAPKN